MTKPQDDVLVALIATKVAWQAYLDEYVGENKALGELETCVRELLKRVKKLKKLEE